MQKIWKAVVRMFKIVGLKTNTGKKKATVCTPGFIWGHQGEAVYKMRAAGEGSTFRDRKITMVICEECG